VSVVAGLPIRTRFPFEVLVIDDNQAGAKTGGKGMDPFGWRAPLDGSASVALTAQHVSSALKSASKGIWGPEPSGHVCRSHVLA
jgi:hypothetical protein